MKFFSLQPFFKKSYDYTYGTVKRWLKWLSHPLVTSLKGFLSFCQIYWVLQPHFFLPYVILPICARDVTKLEMLPCIAGIGRPFAYNLSSGVLRHLELAKQGLALCLEPGIFNLSNQFLRVKFINLCRMAALQRVLTLSRYTLCDVPVYFNRYCL